MNSPKIDDFDSVLSFFTDDKQDNSLQELLNIIIGLI